MISTGGHALSFDIQHIIHSCFRSLVEAKARYFMVWSWTLLWVHHVCGCLSQHQNTFALRPSGTPRPPPGDVEPLEHWDYEQWGVVGSGASNPWGYGQFLRWCGAPRPGRHSWHTDLHQAAVAEQDRKKTKNEHKCR